MRPRCVVNLGASRLFALRPRVPSAAFLYPGFHDRGRHMIIGHVDTHFAINARTAGDILSWSSVPSRSSGRNASRVSSMSRDTVADRRYVAHHTVKHLRMVGAWYTPDVSTRVRVPSPFVLPRAFLHTSVFLRTRGPGLRVLSAASAWFV